MTKAIRFLMLASAILVFLSVSALAQTTGSISGMVRDEKGAIIPKASVTLREVTTNSSRTTTTDDEGRYRFNNLLVGDYEISVETSGFGKYVQSGITLALNQDAVVDVALQAGGVQATVNVVENAALINTSNAEVSVRFDSRRVSELPLATNRNVFNVALGAPGVSQLGSGQSAFSQGVQFSANGGRTRSNNFMIDGQDINDPSVSGGQQAINNPDMVQEVRLITNQFLAEYGRNAGSVLNIVTKSGTNDFHGTVHEFLRNSKLDALGFNANRAGQVKPSFKRNQFGGTFSGPLSIPKLYSGRNRTFFFANYQGTRASVAASASVSWSTVLPK